MTERLMIYGFLGDGGRTFSGGFVDFLRKLDREPWCDVLILDDSGRDYHIPVQHAIARKDQPLAGIGYSLGAWGAAWFQWQLYRRAPSRKISLIAGIDPAGRLAGIIGGLPKSDVFPIMPSVQRCLCFYNSVPWSPISWMFGGGRFVSASNGPSIEYVSSWDDHLLMQYNHGIQSRIMTVLREVTNED